MQAGYYAQTFATFPSQITGGPTWFQVRISTEPILSRGDQLDVLVAFNEHAYDAHKDEVREGGVVVYDSKTFQLEDNGSSLGVPFDQLGPIDGQPEGGEHGRHGDACRSDEHAAVHPGKSSSGSAGGT